jgi:uncharacterized protein YlxW (UPF0749 family)
MGFLVVSQVRSGRHFQDQPEVRTRNLYALATMLRQERQVRRTLEEDAASLTARLRDYERAATEGRTIAEELRRETDRYRLALGLRPVEGQGVAVFVAEPRRQQNPTAPVVVQYQDLVGIVNELWAAGAEAVTVNGQRVTAMTGLGQVGGTILVNLQRVSPPYAILAIGDPPTLSGALAIRGGYVEGLRGLGLDVRIERRDAVSLPAIKALPRFDHLRPAP